MSTEILDDVKIDESIKKDVKQPKKWNVIFLNDNATPMEWVIGILVSIFKHSKDNAEKLTLEVHNKGSAVVGTYSYEVAEQKALEANNTSRNQGFPLQIKLEEQ
jgi:ATP-dependent Clp protease adaptor protein ClpS|tara:strand:+ start:226 stop:537 length:312 start_codon:yes stop_codon:yes gene_type:complete